MEVAGVLGFGIYIVGFQLDSGLWIPGRWGFGGSLEFGVWRITRGLIVFACGCG